MDLSTLRTSRHARQVRHDHRRKSRSAPWAGTRRVGDGSRSSVEGCRQRASIAREARLTNRQHGSSCEYNRSTLFCDLPKRLGRSEKHVLERDDLLGWRGAGRGRSCRRRRGDRLASEQDSTITFSVGEREDELLDVMQVASRVGSDGLSTCDETASARRRSGRNLG